MAAGARLSRGKLICIGSRQSGSKLICIGAMLFRAKVIRILIGAIKLLGTIKIICILIRA
jgi:hypothetical protein